MADNQCPCCAARHAAEDAARNAQAVADQQQDVLNKMRARIVAFAGQLQAWGYTAPARELMDEILIGPVNAPDYFALQIENTALRAWARRWKLAACVWKSTAESYSHSAWLATVRLTHFQRALKLLAQHALSELHEARASHARIVALLCAERDAMRITMEHDNDRSTR